MARRVLTRPGDTVDPATPAHPLGSLIARNLLVLTGGRGLAAVQQFLAFAIIAGHLGPEGLGVYAFAIAAVALARLLPAFGFDLIAPRDIAQQPEREAVLIPSIAVLRVVLGGIAYALLTGLVIAVGYGREIVEATMLAGCTLLLLGAETFRASLATRLRLGWAAGADSLEGAVTLAGAIALALAGADVLPFVALYVLAKLVNVSVVFAAALRLATYRWQIRPRGWRLLLREAAPLAAATLVISVYYRLDLVVLARLAPADDLGQYGLAVKFLDAGVLLTAVVMAVLQPVLARSVLAAPGVLQRVYGQAVHLMALLGVFVAVGGSMTAWRVVPALPGLGEFDGAGVALALLAPAAALILVATIVQGTLLAARHERTVLWISLVGLAVNVALIAVLIPTLSYVGAALATALTELVLIVCSVAAVRRRLALSWPVERLPALLGTALLTAAALTVGYLLPPLLQLTLGVVVFAAASLATGALRMGELRQALGRPATV